MLRDAPEVKKTGWRRVATKLVGECVSHCIHLGSRAPVFDRVYSTHMPPLTNNLTRACARGSIVATSMMAMFMMMMSKPALPLGRLT